MSESRMNVRPKLRVVLRFEEQIGKVLKNLKLDTRKNFGGEDKDCGLKGLN